MQFSTAKDLLLLNFFIADWDYPVGYKIKRL